MTTVAEFYTQVRRDLEEPEEAVWKNLSLLFWGNEAKNDIGRISKSSEDEIYIDLPANTPSIHLPKRDPLLGTTLEIKAVFFRNNPLERRSPQQLEILNDGVLDADVPLYYSVDDENIYVFPLLSSTAFAESSPILRVFRYTLPVDMDSVTSTNLMPFNSLHNAAISYYVRAKAFEQIGDWGAAQVFMNLWRENLAMLQDQATSETYDLDTFEPTQVW